MWVIFSARTGVSTGVDEEAGKDIGGVLLVLLGVLLWVSMLVLQWLSELRVSDYESGRFGGESVSSLPVR